MVKNAKYGGKYFEDSFFLFQNFENRQNFSKLKFQNFEKKSKKINF